MIAEIIIVILLVGILVLLLRHWPETESVVAQQLNVRKPLEERERMRPATSRRWWQKGGDWFNRVEETVRTWFKKKEPTSPMVEKKPVSPVSKHVSKEEQQPPEDSVEVLMSKADTAQRSGNYTEAETCLVKAAAADPKNPKIYSRLGIVYLEQGENWTEAAEAFNQALRYDPGNGYIHNNLGLVLYNQDKFVAALREFEKAVAVDEKIASRHVNLGLAYISLRQFAKAESAFKRATKLDPNNREYHDLLQETMVKRRTHRSG